MRRHRCNDAAFSLVELLVSIAIIGILLALLLPSIQSARESARRAQCGNNFKNLGLAVHSFIAAHGRFPPASTGQAGADSKPRHSVITFLLPHFEQGAVYNALVLNYHWNDTAHSDNEKHAKQHLGGILICPSGPRGREQHHVSDYIPCTRVDPATSGLAAIIGEGRPIADRGPADSPRWLGVLQRDPRIGETVEIRPEDAEDGLSHTFLLVEDVGRPGRYEEGRYIGGPTSTTYRWAGYQLYMVLNDYCQGAQLMNCSNSSQIYSFHVDGCNFLYADGSVRFHQENIEADLLVSLLTMDGGEVISHR